jgi:hypothetical protein
MYVQERLRQQCSDFFLKRLLQFQVIKVELSVESTMVVVKQTQILILQTATAHLQHTKPFKLQCKTCRGSKAILWNHP